MVYFKARETQTSWRLSIQTQRMCKLHTAGPSCCEATMPATSHHVNYLFWGGAGLKLTWHFLSWYYSLFSEEHEWLYKMISLDQYDKKNQLSIRMTPCLDKDHGHTCYRAEQASQILSSARVDASAADLDLLLYFKLSYLIWCRFLSLRRTSCLWFDENPA